MATFNTIKIYDLNGTSTDFPVPFEYMARRFVQVTLLGTGRRPLTLVTEFVFTNSTTIRTLTAWGRPQGYTHIEVRRVTSATDRIVSFNDATILRASDLNAAETQSLHIAEEARDSASEVLSLDENGNLDAKGRRIVNMADPINPGDAMTLRYYEADKDGLAEFKDAAEAAALESSQSAQDAQDQADRAKAVVDSLLDYAATGKGGFSERYGRASTADIPGFMQKLREFRYVAGSEIVIVSFGSSVGVGANVGAADAPGAFFVRELNRVMNPGGIYTFRHINLCVDGSGASELAGEVDKMVLAGIKPAMALTFYGMNDQQPALFNSGPTFPGAYDGLMLGIQKLKALGIDPIIFDSPHASITNHATFNMPASVPQNYPVLVPAPVLPEQMVPPASESGMWVTEDDTGVSIYVSHRAQRISETFALVALLQGVPFISAQRGWYRGLALLKTELGSMSAAEYAVYGPTEVVHPNLAGHKMSYWVEITSWIMSVARGTSSPGSLRTFNGYLRLNARNEPAGAAPAVLCIDQPWPDSTTPSLQVRHRHGQMQSDGTRRLLPDLTFDPATGDMLLHDGAWRVSTTRPADNKINGLISVRAKTYGAVRFERTAGNINGQVSTPVVIDLDAFGSTVSACGDILISGQNSGVGTSPQINRFTWYIKGSVLTITPQGTNVGSGVYTVAVSGKTVRVTYLSDNSNLQYTVLALVAAGAGAS